MIEEVEDSEDNEEDEDEGEEKGEEAGDGAVGVWKFEENAERGSVIDCKRGAYD